MARKGLANLAPHQIDTILKNRATKAGFPPYASETPAYFAILDRRFDGINPPRRRGERLFHQAA
jgi:hypothetical protein